MVDDPGSASDAHELSDEDANRLLRYLDGKHPAEDAVWIARWLGSDQTRRDTLLRASQRKNRSLAQAPLSADERWQLLRARIHSAASTAPPADSYLQRRAQGRLVVRMAAVLLVSLGLAMLWKTLTTPGAPRSIVTPSGQIAHVVLPDGSEVILAAASRLVYPVRFPIAGLRRVQLTGKAQFIVQHHVGRAFVVRAGESVTRVLGTAFTISA